MKRLVTIMAMVALISAFAIADGTNDYKYVENTQELNESLSGINEVAMKNVNGSIKATIGSANEMKLIVYEKVRINDDIDANELIKEAKVVAIKEGSKLVVKIDYGKFKDDKHRYKYTSSFEVVLPARLSVNLVSTNGSVTAPAFDGNVTLETTNGSIYSGGSGKMAKLETTNGDVEIEMVSGEVHAETTNGTVKVKSVAGPIYAGTTNGNVEVTLTAPLAGDIECETTNGSIYFSTVAGSSYTVEADTTHGRVHGPDSLKYNKKATYATGSIGGGKYKVSLDTTNGSIKIK